MAKVVTRNGLELEAQAVVIGAGVAPDVQLAKRAGLEIGESGGVRCSSRLESSAKGVWAAGDICEYDSVMHGEYVRIEHWDVAFNQGKTAALNMLGRDVAHEVVPYFYSVLGDWGELEYVGPAKEWDEEILRGCYEDGAFTNWYLKDGRVKAALTFGQVGRPGARAAADHGRGGAGRGAARGCWPTRTAISATWRRYTGAREEKDFWGDRRASCPQEGWYRRSARQWDESEPG